MKIPFNEQLNNLDTQLANQRTKLEELSKKLNEKFADVRKKELRLYDEIEAIIVREGGGQVTFADGGRYCTIDPSVPDGIKIEYRVDFSAYGQPAKKKDGVITKVESAEDDDTITDFKALNDGYTKLISYCEVIQAAQDVVDTYIGYQTRLVAENDKLIATIEDDGSDEEGYF